MTDLTLDADLVAYVDQARADAVHAFETLRANGTRPLA